MRSLRIGQEFDFEVEGVIPSPRLGGVVTSHNVIDDRHVIGARGVFHEHAAPATPTEGNQTSSVVVASVPLLQHRDVVGRAVAHIHLVTARRQPEGLRLQSRTVGRVRSSDSMDAVGSPATPHQNGRDMMKTIRPVRVRPEVERRHRAQIDASRTADDGLHHEEP